ncbi:hypothetical protein BDV38DRAFT_277370 [Aspergillus pseudotamarii]|uniref:Integral membrane protein, Mpv17/PMP22 family n=1 Tax=Aspergillus pseudotamarii TaxID=132259 RepID=A0A5N6TAI9_ASPPS|nr:uncharacterized protein BDV38DRAFT_277370 [Aspergillus pseudotamarii]KAE8143343.1 hypothetical protein BDV38DRAFT_277370 [Aspergillus pseudotamarii]
MRHTLVTQLGKRPTLSSRCHLPSRRRPQGNRSTSSAPNGPEKNVSPQNAQSKAAPPSSTQSSCSSATPRTVPAGARSRSLRDVIVEGPLGKLGRSYSRIQERRPYATQFWSSIVVYLCGDLSAQVLFPSDSKSAKETARGNSESSSKTESEDNDSATSGGGYDPWRTLRHLTVGAGSSIPSFMFLHHHFNFASKFLSILTKVCVQQAVFTPVFNTYFFSVHSLLSGATFEETWERLKKALPVSITNSAKLWPAVTAFSFMYVPPQFRNIFSGVIAVGWQTYLSWLNQKAAREVEANELAEAAASQIGIGAPATLKA